MVAWDFRYSMLLCCLLINNLLERSKCTLVFYFISLINVESG